MNYAIDVCPAARLMQEDVPEVDEDDTVFAQQQPPAPVNQLLHQFDLLALLTSPRPAKTPLLAPVAVRARFSFIENRYGTRSTLPKKASKHTVDRLANPIHGFTSTLNALPPEVRKKRQQVELSNHPFRGHPTERKVVVVAKKQQLHAVDRLSKPTFVRPKLKLVRPNALLPPILRPKQKPSKAKPGRCYQAPDKAPLRRAHQAAKGRAKGPSTSQLRFKSNQIVPTTLPCVRIPRHTTKKPK
ncbi:hypothetical protein DYB34_008103 [Aphanomyces astaci]|uniref:Uncharacterized protein n=2 Tax=Aphanomyces astaci TaxID=112090 RepID=A0A397EXB6_APHAT|nr:hypothetical protein DYB34_008103 [Aphanomyces astaci]RHZ08320.1 hypothetical protein DYB31_004340 [Aphanomyces astaci]